MIPRPPDWLTRHARDVVASTQSPVPWPHMLICACATGAPVTVGYLRGELPFAIYGSLAGYLIALNDHFGSLRHRWLVTSISFASLTAAFALGWSLRGSPVLFSAALGILTYWLGLMGGTGAEVERLLLFSIIDVVVVYFAPPAAATRGAGSLVFAYGAGAVTTIVLGQFLSARYAWVYQTTTFARLRSSLRGSLTSQFARHRYAIDFTLATGLAAWLVKTFAIERGYWMIITVLLVMRPEFKAGVYRQAQRVIGTVLGVLVGDALILAFHAPALLLPGVFLAAFAVPYGLKRNYWLVSFFATILVVLFLTIPATGHRDGHVPFVRLLATIYGCLLSGTVTAVSTLVTRRGARRGLALSLLVVGALGLGPFGLNAVAAEGFDIYRPARPGPVVMFVHGGAWLGGARQDYRPLGEALAARNLCAVIIDYALAPAFKHPRPIEDLEAARAAVVKSAGPRCDATKIVLVGHSAGAHAVAYWATGPARAAVRGFVGLSGIYDLENLVERHPTYRDWFITAEFGARAAWAAASPGRAKLVVKAPWLLIHPAADELVEPEQSTAFATHLRAQKIAVEVFDPKDETHFGVVAALAKSKSRVTDRLVAFVRRVTR